MEVRRGLGHAEPVDATSMHEWEADRASRLGAGVLFWCWYLPGEVIHWRGAVRAAIRALARDVRCSRIRCTPRLVGRCQ
jgi:hypothetical protein